MAVLFVREALLLRGVVSVEIVQTEQGNYFRVTKLHFVFKGTSCCSLLSTFVLLLFRVMGGNRNYLDLDRVSRHATDHSHRPCLSSGEKFETKQVFFFLFEDGFRTVELERGIWSESGS
jgi:hypothetical protein